MSPLVKLDGLVTRHPAVVVAAWLSLAVVVGVLSPNLTRLAAEGQANLLPDWAESHRAKALTAIAWPEQEAEAMTVVALERKGGLTAIDQDYARRLSRRLESPGRPAEINPVLGPNSPPDVAARLVSHDGSMQLIAVPMSSSFVAPKIQAAVAWMQTQTRDLPPPNGLIVRWSGDAVLGRDYMGNVQTSLDRAAITTVVLLLVVLFIVYRSFWLALIPMVTIGVGLIVSRAALGWLASRGWPVSPLVELFLVALLFGCGTDFCLFISWRFAEHWNPDNPAGAMRVTLERSAHALLTSAGTVMVGLLLMGTTQFRLFSSTGPSVALGLLITLICTLTLTPALLILLARAHPGSFAGLIRPASGFWDRFGYLVMRRPLLAWSITLVLMLPLTLLGLRTHFIQDMVTEMPVATASVQDLRRISEVFGSGATTPLSVVLKSDSDLRKSEGIALIDEVSRLLGKTNRVGEVRSATQPLGTTALLDRARIASRLTEVKAGLKLITDGSGQIQEGLNSGAAKLRAAHWVERMTGLNLTRPAAPAGKNVPDTTDEMVRELTRAADGASQIHDGAGRAADQLTEILGDPVGQRVLETLLVNNATLRDFPDLKRSLDAYISADGHLARIDLVQTDRLFSEKAMDHVGLIRERVESFLAETTGPTATVLITGGNAESADIRALTRSDQRQSWVLVPFGVFIVLWMALRDLSACVNLVATMLLTYCFALGATHVVFITILGVEGLDWKVPYFLFVLLVAVGVDYNVFLMARLREEVVALGLRRGIIRAVAQTGGLITSAAAITACSFASFLSSPLASLRQLGFALVVGIAVDAILVRPLLVPCGHWLWHRRKINKRLTHPPVVVGPVSRIADPVGL